MKYRKLAATALAGSLLATAALAQETTPEMVEAARAENPVVWYTAVDVQVAEAAAAAFREAYPGLDVVVERSGSERVFQRLEQEYSAGIHAVDVVNSSDASHFVYWKNAGILASHTPPDALLFDEAFRDEDGMYHTWRAHLSVIGYNTELVPEDRAPTSFADLLDPVWENRLVKAHPSYSGTIVTATQAIVDTLGWEYLEALSRQGVMQVQSSTAPPTTIGVGERMAMADGNEYNMFIEIAKGTPVAIVYAEEGTPFIDSPSAIMEDAPNPNAARVFSNWLFSADAQQILVNMGGLRSVHPDVVEPADRTPLTEIKLIYTDPEAILAGLTELKERYASLFGE